MCGLADRYQHFVWSCCLHHHDCKRNESRSYKMLVFVYKNLQHHIPEILATLYKILHFRRLSYSSHCEDLKSQTFSLQFPFWHPTTLIICIYCLMLLTVLMDKLCSFLQSPVTQFFISWISSYELCSWICTRHVSKTHTRTGKIIHYLSAVFWTGNRKITFWTAESRMS
jgi:hypothetical protein